MNIGHVAIIMDGNGRWAQDRGMARGQGHVEGAEAVRRIVRHARRRGDIDFLTLFAFIEQGGVRVHINKLDATGQGIESVIVVH